MSGTRSSLLGVALVLTLVTAAQRARAGNQNSFFLGNTAAITGGAVVVVGDDGASLWYNPAGLVAIVRPTLDLSGSAYMLRVRDYPGLLRGDLPDRPTEADPRLDLGTTEVLSVPSALAYVRRVGPDLSLGFGLFVPLLDGFDATSELALREERAHLDAAVDLAADTTIYGASVGVGWRASPDLRLGASLGLFLQSGHFEQVLLFAYDSPIEGDPVLGNGAIVQEDDVTRFGVNMSFGVQWQVADAWAVGLVVRTPLLLVYESFERRRFRVGADVAPDGTTSIASEFAPIELSGFEGSVYLNVSGVLGVAWTPEPGAFLGLELELQPGSEDDGIVRELVWNLRLGGTLPVSDTVRLGAGLFTDRSWDPRPTEAWSDRVNYYGVAAGVTLETPLRLSEHPDVDSLIFMSTFGVRYAIGFGETLRAVADPSGIRTDPTMTRLDLVFHEISLHVGSGLRF